MKWIPKKRVNSVLGLTLDGHNLRAAHVRRTKATVEVVQSLTTSLTLDAAQHEVDLLGREIRNALDAAGIHERFCVVGLPARWIMSQTTKLPELSREDAQSFLEMEAERGFPCSLEQLQIVRSSYRSPEGSLYVTQLAVRKEQLDRIFAILKAAGLRPSHFTLGLATLPKALAGAGLGMITVALDGGDATLLVSADGGIAAFRTCDSSIESEPGERVLNGASVARELRLTVEQVPADLRPLLGRLTLIGDEALVSALAESVADRALITGLAIETKPNPTGELGEMIVESLARHGLKPSLPLLEFMPPRPGRWAGLVARYHSKRLATIGAAVGAVALMLVAAFCWQAYQAWSLRQEWDAMKTQVGALETVQGRIREYRSWYDSSFPNLNILRRVTEAFPDTGSVTAKSFEIHGLSTVSVTGISRENTALLRTLDQLRKMREVQAVKVEQISGKSPSPFNFTFHWNESTSS